jgi:hypothetical protein
MKHIHVLDLQSALVVLKLTFNAGSRAARECMLSQPGQLFSECNGIGPK